MLEEASERLLTASADIATLPVIIPAKNLKAQSRVLHTMPTIPARLPHLERTAGSPTESGYPDINLLSKNSVINYPADFIIRLPKKQAAV